MSAGHTPGPWEARDVRYNRDFRTCVNVMTADGLRFVAAVSCDPHTDSGQLQANARLIAAAPALLGSLEGIAKVVAGYKSQMKFCDIEALGYFREFVSRIEAVQYAEAIAFTKVGGV